jgi:hypothetical protein
VKARADAEEDVEFYRAGIQVRRPASPLSFMDYGDMSVKPIGVSLASKWAIWKEFDRNLERI